MPRISVQNLGQGQAQRHKQDLVFDYEPGKNLLEILMEHKVFVENPCNGKGSCGKCKVRIVAAECHMPEIGETERGLLSRTEIENGVRLACLVIPNVDLVVETLQAERKQNILTQGYMPEFEFEPVVAKRVVILEKPTLENQKTFEQSICDSFGIPEMDFRILREQKPTYDTLTGVFSGNRLMGIEQGNTSDQLYGIAVDIGTTTVVAELIDMTTGNVLKTVSRINPQKKFGLDVLTRISYATEKGDEGRLHLQQEIVAAIRDMVDELCEGAGLFKQHVYEMTVAANCTMLHFLLGVDASSIGKAPYAPAFVGAKHILASEIGLELAPGASIYCLPSVSAYIGADIVAGAYVCQLHKRDDQTLFIDIGTNGEIVLSDRGKLISCSCAAGPALEGMNISSGMRAENGAVEEVQINGDKVELKVIGDEPPVGLCGSGILGAVKELIRTGLVKPDGAFIKKETLAEDDVRHNILKLDGSKRVCLLTQEEEPLKITQKDVRQVQLAKGAILSGFYALLKETGIAMEELDTVMIAGQFGAHLPVESLTGVGILPKEVGDKLIYVGNSSKTGAYMSLMSASARREMEALAGQMAYMELGATEGYERLFSQCLIFPK